MISCYFGFPRCGKSTLLCRLALYYQSKNIPVYTVNISIKGCTRLNFEDLPYTKISHAVVLIDEITLSADNRDFKSFSKDLKRFFVLHGHLHLDIIYCTQFYDWVDLKIRRMTEYTYYVKRFPFFSLVSLIPQSLLIPEQTGDITMGYKLPNLFSRKYLVFRPRYYKYFDTEEMPPIDYKFIPIVPSLVKHRFVRPAGVSFPRLLRSRSRFK